MNIVKRGKLVERKFKGTCNGCKSILEATRGELKIEFDQRENGEFGRGSCPVCKNFHVIFYPKVTR